MGGREFESRSWHLKQETKLREERGLSGCRKGLKTVPLAQALPDENCPLLGAKECKFYTRELYFFPHRSGLFLSGGEP